MLVESLLASLRVLVNESGYLKFGDEEVKDRSLENSDVILRSGTSVQLQRNGQVSRLILPFSRYLVL